MLFRGLAVALVIAAADQLTKLWIVDYFAARPTAGNALSVTDFFNLVLIGNSGMSFGLFNTGNRIHTLGLTIVAVIIVAALIVWLRRVGHLFLAVAIGLVIGGAIGNFIDRVWRGAVVDFLDFHLGTWHWYAFNLADSAICIGVGLMLIDSLLARREAPN